MPTASPATSNIPSIISVQMCGHCTAQQICMLQKQQHYFQLSVQQTLKTAKYKSYTHMYIMIYTDRT